MHKGIYANAHVYEDFDYVHVQLQSSLNIAVEWYPNIADAIKYRYDRTPRRLQFETSRGPIGIDEAQVCTCAARDRQLFA